MLTSAPVKENFPMTTNVKRWLWLFRILEDAKARDGTSPQT
jgi:hypothetical protein